MGVTQYTEISPGLFLGYFEHFLFFGHVELSPLLVT